MTKGKERTVAVTVLSSSIYMSRLLRKAASLFVYGEAAVGCYLCSFRQRLITFIYILQSFGGFSSLELPLVDYLD